MRPQNEFGMAAAVAVLALTAIIIASVPQRVSRAELLTKHQAMSKQGQMQMLAGPNEVSFAQHLTAHFCGKHICPVGCTRCISVQVILG